MTSSLVTMFLIHFINSLVCCLKVEGGVGVNDMANTMMQKFWDSALALELPDEEYDSRRSLSPFLKESRKRS